MSEVKASYEVVVIGGGPAGMSTALWCGDQGLRAALIERGPGLGGQLHRIHNPVSNYLGLRAANGREVLDHFLDSIKDASFEQFVETEVVDIDRRSMCARLSDGSEVRCEAFVIATGVRRRRLGIPGEREFRGKGVIESGARDAEEYRGKSVVIIGGGDAAFENALILSEYASEVAIAFRKSEPAARKEFVSGASQRPNVKLLPETVVKKIEGNSLVESVEVEAGPERRMGSLQVDGVLIRIGVEPNSELVRHVVELDRDGYVIVNRNGETSVPGIFAVGDVANPGSPTISTAAGTGATAAKTIYCSITSRRGMIRT